MAKSEAKPRKNIQYKDVAAAVAKLDNLQFLSDVVPRTMTYKQVKEKDQRVEANKEAKDTGTNGHVDDDATGSKQRTIADMMAQGHAHTNGTNGSTDEVAVPLSPAQQRISLSMATSPIVDRTVQQNGHAHSNGHPDDDVEMGD